MKKKHKTASIVLAAVLVLLSAALLWLLFTVFIKPAPVPEDTGRSAVQSAGMPPASPDSTDAPAQAQNTSVPE